MYQHRMTHIAVQGIGINSDQFRDTMDRHLEAMSMSGWELVSTDVSEQISTFKGASSVDALLFWRKPEAGTAGTAGTTGTAGTAVPAAPPAELR